MRYIETVHLKISSWVIDIQKVHNVVICQT